MQKDSVTDIELNLKKKARRRLVGAIALVLLMIVLLPVLLKDRVEVSDQNEVKITIDNQVEQSAVDKHEMIVPEGFDSNVVPADNETPAKPLDSPDVKESNVPVNEAKPVEEPKSTTQAATKTEKPVSPSAYYVQVGVFSDPVNVKQLQAKLSELGYKSRTEKISTAKGEKLRLRTQAFSSRNEAAIALGNIKDAGLTGMVVSQ